MKAIRLFYHADCQTCARSSARIERWWDWRDRVEFSTALPSTGPLRIGEIAIENLATGRIFKGARAFGQLCRHVPIYAPASLLLIFPAARAWLGRALGGCEGDACRVAAQNPNARLPALSSPQCPATIRDLLPDHPISNEHAGRNDAAGLPPYSPPQMNLCYRPR